MKFANNGKSVICGEWTSEMKTHFKVSIAHCSDKDKFNKKEGKDIASGRMLFGECIVLPVAFNYRDNKPFNLVGQLRYFLGGVF